MKILIITPAYYPDTSQGGSITGCRNFCRALNHKANIEISTLNTLSNNYKEDIIDNIPIRYFKKTKGLEWLSKSGWGFSKSFAIWFIGNFRNYDFIYIRSLWNFTSLFASIVCLIGNKKYGFSSSGKFTKEAFKSSSLKKFILLPIIYLILKKSKLIHYPSEEEYEKTINLIKKTTKKLIANTAVDNTSLFYKRQSSKKNPITLIYTVSRFDPIKRIYELANEFVQLKGNVQIIHFGEFNKKNKYFQKIKDFYQKNNTKICYGLKDIDLIKNESKVIFAGFISINKVNEICNRYEKTIFIQNSLSEGQSNSVLEAISRNSLCIVSSGCNMNYAFKEKVLEIIKKNDLKKKLNFYLDFKKKDMDEIAKNQNLFIQKYHSFESVGNEIYRQLVLLI